MVQQPLNCFKIYLLGGRRRDLTYIDATKSRLDRLPLYISRTYRSFGGKFNIKSTPHKSKRTEPTRSQGDFPIQDPLQTYTHEPRTTVDQKGMTRAQHERTKVLEAALKEKVQQIEECRRELRQKDRENASLQQNVDKMLKKLPEQDKGEFKHINQGNIILRLRDHEKLPWKLVESRFATETGLHRAWMSLAHEYYSIRNQSQHASMPEDAQVCLSQHNCCTTQAR